MGLGAFCSTGDNMFNETEIQGPARPPFDVSALLEEQVQALAAERAGAVPRASLRRPIAIRDSAEAGSTPRDASALAAPPAEASAAAAERDPLLEARQNTHGSFADNARVSQAIKRIFRDEPGWGLLTDVERESMDMIALKFSRILSGKSLELQHWEDVRGYAGLAEEQCKVIS